ncbi:MAG: hypothetical protein JST28_09285, partial [Acidobacteria bacterium]|nr:hypothetical protein [Acidobacteriota bacterium]
AAAAAAYAYAAAAAAAAYACRNETALANDASSARAKALTELADVVRRAIPIPFVAPAEVAVEKGGAV